MKTFVFLHDAFQGGWVWENVAQALRNMDCGTYTPSLTGCGERSHLHTQSNPFATYLDDILNLFDYEDIDDAILVCNGIAGTLAPMLVKRLGDRIAGVVFLDALLPQPGKSFKDSIPQSMQDALNLHSSSDMVQPRPSPLLELLTVQTELRKLSPFPLQAFLEPYSDEWPQQWPTCHFLHCSGSEDSFSMDMLDRAHSLDMNVHERPLSEHPYWMRHEEIANTLKLITDAPEMAEFGPCGRRRMPESMRMAYCAHHRKRVTMTVVPDRCAAHSAA